MNMEFPNTLLAMAGFAFATSATPGPVNVISAMSGARFGPMKTLSYVSGATLGFVSILAITGMGLSSAITHFPKLERVLALLGALYILYLSCQIMKSAASRLEGDKLPIPPGIFSGISAQYTNPKAWIVSISAVSIYVTTGAHHYANLLIFCALFLLICFPCLFMWSIAGASVAGKLMKTKLFNIVMSLLLLVSLLPLIFSVFTNSLIH